MTKIEEPTVFARDGNWEFRELSIRADDVSAQQYCTDNGYTYSSYTADDAHFANDGARIMNYYDTTKGKWENLFSYDAIITEIVTT